MNRVEPRINRVEPKMNQLVLLNGEKVDTREYLCLGKGIDAERKAEKAFRKKYCNGGNFKEGEKTVLIWNGREWGQLAMISGSEFFVFTGISPDTDKSLMGNNPGAFFRKYREFTHRIKNYGRIFKPEDCLFFIKGEFDW